MFLLGKLYSKLSSLELINIRELHMDKGKEHTTMISNLQAIDSWFPILKWTKLPNFGPCNTIDSYQEFFKHYFISQELCRFKTNLLATLTGEFEQQNIRLMGRPGCGKTSFVYYLIKEAMNSSGGALSRYFIHIFHANRAAGAEVEKTVMDYILTAWERYYATCGKGDVFYRISSQKLTVKDKINTLVDYYKAKKTEFSRLMIFVIDDADLLSNDEVREVVKAVLRNLALSVVKKWLVIREVTYNGYDVETRRLVDAFFSDRRLFPQISLFDIICHRIRNVAVPGSNEKIPFSEDLCFFVLEKLFDGNMREALATLRSILEFSEPGDIRMESDQVFIQNYFDRNAVNTFLQYNFLPNLYDPIYRSSPFPLAIDILCTVRYIRNQDLVRGVVSMATEWRVDVARIVGDSQTVRMREHDYDFSVQKLIDLGLLEKEGKSLYLTPKGELLTYYVTRPHYQDRCRLMIYEPGKEADAFWKLVKVSVDHWEIVLKMLAWDKPEDHNR